jgi:protein-S-isoprenylcysteine O-methyltransferase Ste14
MQRVPAAPSLAARTWAWGGALLFVASLSYFLYSYAITFAETAPPEAEAGRAALVDVFLFTVFALHHSVFARERIRTQVARLVPPGLERSFYVWVASALFIGVCALWQPVPGIAWSLGGPLRWACVVVQAAAIWLILRSAATIDPLDLAGVRQLSPASGETTFKTSGPYGWVRHPIYAGWFLLVFCVPLMTMTRLVFAIVSSAYVVMAIPFEERSLLATAGDAYRRYLTQVRWRLVPGLY